MPYLFDFIPSPAENTGYAIWSVHDHGKAWYVFPSPCQNTIITNNSYRLGGGDDFNRAIREGAKGEIIDSLATGLDGDFFVKTRSKLLSTWTQIPSVPFWLTELDCPQISSLQMQGSYQMWI
jgi:hypothetical protein